jgi:hypothetical protein
VGQLCTGGADGLPHSLAFMAAEIVDDDDVAGLERRDQNLLDISQEAFAVAAKALRTRSISAVSCTLYVNTSTA